MVHRTPFLLPMLYSSLVWRMPTDSKSLYLTFDDGPVPGPTEFVLETLKKYGVKGTFFCIGDNVRKYGPIFNSLRDNGHAIGNHTFNHLNGWKTAADEYQRNIHLCRDEIFRQLNWSPGSAALLFRPPFGRISRSQIRMVRSEYKIIMWDVLSMDYNRKLSPVKCLANTIAAARAGSIVVFHDSYKAEGNLKFALPRFIEYYLDRGFTFKAIS